MGLCNTHLKLPAFTKVIQQLHPLVLEETRGLTSVQKIGFQPCPLCSDFSGFSKSFGDILHRAGIKPQSGYFWCFAV